MTLPAPGSHGGDGVAVARALGLDPASVLDLSQSLNPLAPDPVAVVARHLDAVRSYPDASGASGALADAMGVGRDELLLTNGGAEAIALVATELGGRVAEPEFGLHPRAGGPLWRSNPHSPSGLLAAADERADVWDEAFYPLATGHWTRGDGTAVVGSLTKLLACPGLRLGYVVGDPHLIGRVRARQAAWSVSGLAAAALPELLDAVDLLRWCEGITTLRHALVGLLSAHGLRVRPSDANWVLVEHGGLRAALAPHGVVVRDCASFGLPGVTRIAVPSEAGLCRLDEALVAASPLLGGSGAQDEPRPATLGISTRPREAVQ
ncbi:MAG TPA: aminotransferase class I/II-fold pyridoxal phosphate-dependent enzyme [Acidimicrobiales bacterium]|nr:aminotransferase class I/II-fold pyridoxal phosphate-dependent enzyme [Acidimicrobiales bacterium]